MPIAYNVKQYPVSWLINQYKKGKLDTNISIQRKEIWDYLYKSNQIMAMLRGRSISNLTLEKVLDANGKILKYLVLDGKQRTLTLCAYLDNVFALSNKMRFKEIDGADLTGLFYSQISDELQDYLMNAQLSIEVYDPLTEDEREFVFYMGNQSVPLSTTAFLVVVLGEIKMNDLNILRDHPFITQKIKLTPAGIRKDDDLKFLVNYLILRSERDMGFSKTELISFSDDIKNNVVDLPIEKINKVLDYLNEALDKKRPYLKLVHISTILYVAEKAMDGGMMPEVFGEKLDGFFEDLYQNPNSDYMLSCKGGSAKRHNVQQRREIMMSIVDGKGRIAPKQLELTDKKDTVE